MIALVPIRDGVLPAGADETIAECGGRVVFAGSGLSTLGLDGLATEVFLVELGDVEPGRWSRLLAAVCTDIDRGAGDGPSPIVLPASPDGRDLAPRLAAELGLPLLAGATSVAEHTVKLARRGGLELHEVHPDGGFVATLLPGVRGAERFTATARVTTLDAPATTDAPGMPGDARVVEVLAPDVRTMDLGEARRIVGGGAGLDTEQRFVRLDAFAGRIGGVMGATRVITDRGWVHHDRQIGTTGVVVDPELYVSFGVSGAVQHVSGLGAPDHIISVNTDPHCPMMAMSDLAIVSDANATLDALVELLGTDPPGADVSIDVDVVVVGAGPAGACAATVLARAGHSVVLLERGAFPGAKNMYGGVVYPRILDRLHPKWWEDAPIQRWITRRSTMILTADQALTVDFRSGKWGRPPYNGATAYRPDWDHWLAGKAEAEGAQLICATTATGLLRDDRGRVCGVTTDRPDGDLTARLVIACDGVNSFLAKEAGLYGDVDAANYTLGVKETIGLPKDVIDERFAVRDREGVDVEILGGTSGVNGGGFLYTNLDTVSVGVVLKLPKLAAQQRRPEEIIATLKGHPAIAPLVEGGEVKEYSAHLIPEAGLAMMPKMTGDGLLVAGDAAAMCLAAGIWLEGVNFAMASGMYAGEAAVDALRANDTSATGLRGYERRLGDTFVLRDHRKLRRAPSLVLSDRVQHLYPDMIANTVERMFRVDNPSPKPGLRRILREERKGAGVKLRELARDTLDGLRTFG